MDDIKIKIMPASMGDCFLISTMGDEKTNIIIDMGYGETYRKFLKDELIEISKMNQSIDLMVITHIDSDHIVGGLSFLEENNKSSDKININEIWHNTLRHISIGDESKDKIAENDKEILDFIKLQGYKLPEDSEDRRNILISGIQGTSLGAHIKRGDYNWNKATNGKAICTDKLNSPYRINDVEIVLLTPNRSRLDELSNVWKDEFLKNKGFKGKIMDNELFDDVFEMMISNSFETKILTRNKLICGSIDLESYIEEDDVVDEKVANCSSISFILNYKNKRVLFLGDSNPEDVYKSIKDIFDYNGEEKIYFDAIKVSHHGSEGNTTKKLMSMIDSNKFIISTNGRHGHPSIKTIAKIVCRECSKPRELIFNYKDVAERFESSEDMNKYKYIVRYDETNEIQEICI